MTRVDVSGPGAESAAQDVRRALALLAERRRANGSPVPGWLAGATVHACSASTRQEPPDVEDHGEVTDSAAVPRLLWSYDDVADALSVGRRTVERLVHDQRLPAVHLGGRALVRPCDVAAFVDGLARTAGSEPS